MSNSLDPYQDPHSVGPDLGPNCLQKVISRQKILQLARKGLIITISHISSIEEVKTTDGLNHLFQLEAGTGQSECKTS